VGLDRVKGYLLGGMAAYAMSGYRTTGMESISVEELKERLDRGELTLVDTRLKSEYETFHIEKSIHMAAPDVRSRGKELQKFSKIAFICNSGNRSLLAASLRMQQSKKQRIINVIGGTSAWKDLGYPIV
jgi:hydroxyacylglutathione hydrolase